MTTTSETAAPVDSDYTRRLTWLFGLVYFAQGICQDSGLVSQPLANYFKASLGYDPAQLTEALAVLAIPWTIKPLYGLVSDFIPLAGYRRRTWLLITNLLVAGGFLWLVGVTAPGVIITALFLTALGTAASDVIIDAIMIENGRASGKTAEFQSVQWLWMSIASIVSGLLGGWLAEAFTPDAGLKTAAAIAMAMPLAVLVACWATVREDRVKINVKELAATSRALAISFRSRTIWAVLAFLAFWNFSPSFGTPWYYHQTDRLGFSQLFIGTLHAAASVGAVIGALAYWRYFARLTMRRQLIWGIWTGTIGTLSYLLLLHPNDWSQAIALGIEFTFGAVGMVALLATLTLAAQACPPKSEGFTFAALMSIVNGVTQISGIIGARLYTDVFNSSMAPLILTSAAFTAACWFTLPWAAKVGAD